MRWPVILRRVSGDSMAPTLKHGQIVVVLRGSIVSGGVVMAKQNGREVVKRISSIEQLPKGHYSAWLLGDNAAASSDSRTYGAVLDADIFGYVVWPARLRRKPR